MTKRKLLELNLLDDFLIAVLISHPIYGETFCKEILRIIFKREFHTLKITPQKIYPGRDTDLHGARLDVYLEGYTGYETEKPTKEYIEKTTKENAVTEALKRIHKIVELVKREEEVELRYMKALERRTMWINKGKEEERMNTERERQKAERERQKAERERQKAEREHLRAEQERLRAERAEAELMRLKVSLGTC